MNTLRTQGSNQNVLSTNTELKPNHDWSFTNRCLLHLRLFRKMLLMSLKTWRTIGIKPGISFSSLTCKPWRAGVPKWKAHVWIIINPMRQQGQELTKEGRRSIQQSRSSFVSISESESLTKIGIWANKNEINNTGSCYCRLRVWSKPEPARLIDCSF